MSENPQNEDEEVELPTSVPGTLDVVTIDGKWAQVKGAGLIVFLEEIADRQYQYINWNDYLYERIEGVHFVADLRDKDMISDREYGAVHWGPEQNDFPHLRGSVTVFGSYTMKKLV